MRISDRDKTALRVVRDVQRGRQTGADFGRGIAKKPLLKRGRSRESGHSGAHFREIVHGQVLVIGRRAAGQ